jgi:hypothetical protein
MTMWRQKSNDEGKKEQKWTTGIKSSCSQIGVWNLNLECIWHTLFEECVGRGGFVFTSSWVHIWPGLKSGTQRVPHHVSRYCRQNSGYAGCFCPGGSVCNVPLWKVTLFVRPEFSLERDNKLYFKFCRKKVVLLIYRTMLRMLGFGE